MASVEKEQQLLREKGYSQPQIEQMTSEYFALANILVDQYFLDKKAVNNNEKTV